MIFDINVKKKVSTLAIVIRFRQLLKLLTVGSLFCSFLLSFFLTPGWAKQTCKDSIMPTAPASNFNSHNDGTATDNTTGLMWMRCSMGQIWNGETCSGTPAIFSWTDSLKAAENHEFASYSDWRLPNKNELESIVENRCYSPAINTGIFPATPAAYFWSSSPYAVVSDGAWSVDFGYGTVNASVKSGLIHIRLVRDSD
ncbi:DUF1566 domain-containing protein [Thermodesulfobacteriota bacterium]